MQHYSSGMRPSALKHVPEAEPLRGNRGGRAGAPQNRHGEEHHPAEMERDVHVAGDAAFVHQFRRAGQKELPQGRGLRRETRRPVPAADRLQR